MEKPYNFRAYRLNVIHTVTLFNQHLGRVESDDQIVQVLSESASPNNDLIIEGKENIYRWAVRDVDVLEHKSRGRVVSFKVVRSIVREPTDVLTDENVHRDYVDYDPPKAVAITCLLFIDRHVVTAEYNSVIMQSEKWRENFSSIASDAALKMDLASTLNLEPIPSKNEILDTFASFAKLTRLRLYLRLPNPELGPHAKQLYGEMKKGGILEYLQDMKNPNGINQGKNALPYAAADIAQNGYKKGDVKFEGVREGQFEKVSAGATATQGSVPRMKDFVRGLRANTKTKEAARVLDAVASELERVVPKPRADEKG